MMPLGEIHKETVRALQNRIPNDIACGIVLGSGFGEALAHFECLLTIETNELPGYPKATVEGHKGKLHIVRIENKKVFVFQGRIHPYEGYPLYQCILPVYLMHSFGIRYALLTNAAGGINRHFVPGDFMLASSYNGIGLKKELTGLMRLATYDQRKLFTDSPSRFLNGILRNAACEEKIPIKEGTYWYTKGPSYETPAEIEMFERFGADAVGMSTVHEAVFASAAGMEVSILSLIANFAAGKSPNKITHEEVQEAAHKASAAFEKLLRRFVLLLPSAL